MDIKEHGMLYKAEMVNAIMREIDPKEQTRRPVTFANSLTGGAVKRKEWHLLDWDRAVPWTVEIPIGYGKPFDMLRLPAWRVPFKGGVVPVYPRIWPGHRIWVRETWRVNNWYYTDGRVVDIKYIADEVVKRFEWVAMADFRKFCKDKNHPSLFLPRWASRIDLNVTGMRSQRIQEISEGDCKAEGVIPTSPLYGDCGGHIHKGHRESFHKLWDSINTERGFPWAGNHPVWIHDFKRINKEADSG